MVSRVRWVLWDQNWGTGMVNRVRWVLWGRDWRDWDHQWDQLGAMGLGPGRLGGLGWSMGSVECYGVRTGGIGMVSRVRWVLWGGDWWDWDPQWDQLGAMGPGQGVVNRIHWVLWGRDWWDWVDVRGVAWHHVGVQERAST